MTEGVDLGSVAQANDSLTSRPSWRHPLTRTSPRRSTGRSRAGMRSAERMFGFSAEEIVGRNIRVLIPEERQAEEDEILARLRAGRTSSTTRRCG